MTLQDFCQSLVFRALDFFPLLIFFFFFGVFFVFVRAPVQPCTVTVRAFCRSSPVIPTPEIFVRRMLKGARGAVYVSR